MKLNIHKAGNWPLSSLPPSVSFLSISLSLSGLNNLLRALDSQFGNQYFSCTFSLLLLFIPQGCLSFLSGLPLMLEIILVLDLLVWAQRPPLCTCLSSQSCDVCTGILGCTSPFFAYSHSKKAH